MSFSSIHDIIHHSFIIIYVTRTDLTGQSEELEMFMFRPVSLCQNATTGISHRIDGSTFSRSVCTASFLFKNESINTASLSFSLLLLFVILALFVQLINADGPFEWTEGRMLPNHGRMLMEAFITRSVCASVHC